MAVNKKITECAELTTAPAADDLLAVVDVSDSTDAASGTTKKQQWLNTIKWLFGSRFGADAGANDTYVVTLVPAPAAYITGEHYRFKANTANTGACTVNFNGLGAKTIKKAAGGITTDLADNDIRAGQWVDLIYDGTNMQMQSLLGNAPGSGSLGGNLGATDNVILRADGTGGVTAQGSTISIDDTGAITVPEMAAPATPAANKVAIYAKSDGKLYIKDDAGTETDLAATGSLGGSTGATDNRALRADGTGGATVQSSNLTIPDDAATTEVGYMNIPQNSQSTNYTAVLADRASHLFHPSGDNNARTFTIPANASVAFAVGTVLTFVNKINTLTIAITSDTLTWAKDGTTGSRTLAANGVATALKITSTEWLISGEGLS